MISGAEKHQKHVPLTRIKGVFGRNEVSILGTPCSHIQQLVNRITTRLSARHRLAYIDADHKARQQDLPQMLGQGGSCQITDKIDHYQVSLGQPDPFQLKTLLHAYDMILVNGNHFEASAQVVVIDPRKSLEKKLHKLTNVQLILLAEEIKEIPAYLQNHLGESLASVPVLRIEQEEKLLEWLMKWYDSKRAEVKGLVLAGGKSLRMQKDKGLLNYHGKPQREYTYDIVAPFCQETYISCRPDQLDQFNPSYPGLADTFTELGPLGAVLSAFRRDPEAAWLIVASDLPLLSARSIEDLVRQRNPAAAATAFRQLDTGFPEPLIAIWEPKSYLTALQFLGLGYSCPRKILINSDCKIIDPPDPMELKNVNDQEAYQNVKKMIQNRGSSV
ncbi:MAG: NTP transferase domain-containing protein [Candidatus Cyclobacteriaceae bacterium M3_2C_046]